MGGIHVQIQFEHIDAWLAEEAGESSACVFGDELPNLILGQIAGLCNPRDLE